MGRFVWVVFAGSLGCAGAGDLETQGLPGGPAPQAEGSSGSANEDDDGSPGGSDDDGQGSSGAAGESTSGGEAPEDGGSSSETGGQPGQVIDPIGCADGQREGYINHVQHPEIAACAGGWAVPGLVGGVTSCNREGGDDGLRTEGYGCAAEDLCAVGWHLCEGSVEVALAAADGCAEANNSGDPWLKMWATTQSGPGDAACGEGTNDFFGCGTIGQVVSTGPCLPLDRSSGDLCEDVREPWNCGTDPANEIANVTKLSSLGGGVLCCSD